VAWLERCRSSIHYACYELPDLKPVPVILDALKPLIADFDRVWGTRVTRTREIIETKQLIQSRNERGVRNA
jgi:hypothetical protein